MRRLLFSLTVTLFCFSSNAARVDTVLTFSPSMQKDIKAVVVLPDAYETDKEYPVIYLLHGYSGNYSNYIKSTPKIKDYADNYSIIFVCPDGNYGSWYFDSPVDSSWKYETYIATELIQWIDDHYSTIKDRKGRAITGLSMGGHGALYLAFKHQDTFGSAGSMSGGVDIRPYPNNWELAKRLGDYATHKQNWEDNTVINMVHLLTPNSLRIIFDCGSEDFFYKVNNNLHEKLLERNIPHDYISRPGGHSWDYWNNSIEYQVLFFVKGFGE
ncbi:MAG: esterase family protein [Chitinophagaceae bacterium]|nr:esterase family protein [Chitinophagaceae bacterium]